MPPPIPAALLKAVIYPSSRHHHHPLHFVNRKQQKPSSSIVVALSTTGSNRTETITRRINTTTRDLLLIRATIGGGSGCWMRPGPGRGFSGGGKDGGAVVQSHSTGSLHHSRRSEEEKGEIFGDIQQQEGPSASGLFTLPTVLTLSRVAAIPLLVSTFYMNAPWATTATTSIFLAAAITDWLDGYIARKMRLRTDFGAFLDPVADKLMVATTLVLLCTRPLEVAIFGEVPWLLSVPSIAIIGREITMSAVREWAAAQDSRVLEAVAVNNLGKWKTAAQMTALTILLFSRDASITGASFLVPSGVVLLYTSAGLGVWSLVVYMRSIWRILLK